MASQIYRQTDTSSLKYNDAALEPFRNLSKYRNHDGCKEMEKIYVVPATPGSGSTDWYRVEESRDRIRISRHQRSEAKKTFVAFFRRSFTQSNPENGRTKADDEKVVYKVIMTSGQLPARKVANTLEDLIINDKNSFIGHIEDMTEDYAAQVLKHLAAKHRGGTDGNHLNDVVKTIIEKRPRVIAVILSDEQRIPEDCKTSYAECFFERIASIKDENFTKSAINSILKEVRHLKQALIIKELINYSQTPGDSTDEKVKLAKDVIITHLTSLSPEDKELTLKMLKCASDLTYFYLQNFDRLRNYGLKEVKLSDEERTHLERSLKLYREDPKLTFHQTRDDDVTDQSEMPVVPAEFQKESASARFNDCSPSKLTEPDPEKPTVNQAIEEDIELKTIRETKVTAGDVTEVTAGGDLDKARIDTGVKTERVKTEAAQAGSEQDFLQGVTKTDVSCFVDITNETTDGAGEKPEQAEAKSTAELTLPENIACAGAHGVSGKNTPAPAAVRPVSGVRPLDEQETRLNIRDELGSVVIRRQLRGYMQSEKHEAFTQSVTERFLAKGTHEVFTPDILAGAFEEIINWLPEQQVLDDWAKIINDRLRAVESRGVKAQTPAKSRGLPAAAASTVTVTGIGGATSQLTPKAPVTVLPAAEPRAVRNPSQGRAIQEGYKEVDVAADKADFFRSVLAILLKDPHWCTEAHIQDVLDDEEAKKLLTPKIKQAIDQGIEILPEIMPQSEKTIKIIAEHQDVKREQLADTIFKQFYANGSFALYNPLSMATDLLPQDIRFNDEHRTSVKRLAQIIGGFLPHIFNIQVVSDGTKNVTKLLDRHGAVIVEKANNHYNIIVPDGFFEQVKQN